MDGPGDIFVVHLLKFVISREPVYLIGSHRVAFHRHHGYPEGSELICRFAVPRMRDAENAFIALCHERLQNRMDIGFKYFQGDAHEVVRAACEVVHEQLHPRERMGLECIAHNYADADADADGDGDGDGVSKRYRELSTWLVKRITETSYQEEITRKYVRLLIGMRGVVDPENIF